MGYISDIALHVKGHASKFIQAQKAYYKALEESPVVLWGGPESMWADTFHETKEGYVHYGKCIWNELKFEFKDDYVYGERLWEELKWLRYCKHQCDILLKVLTQHGYSWYYIGVGETDEDVVVSNNSGEIKDFDEEVFKPYIISHDLTRPRLSKVKDDSS